MNRNQCMFRWVFILPPAFPIALNCNWGQLCIDFYLGSLLYTWATVVISYIYQTYNYLAMFSAFYYLLINIKLFYIFWYISDSFCGRVSSFYTITEYIVVSGNSAEITEKMAKCSTTPTSYLYFLTLLSIIHSQSDFILF